jgi:hypothetical protein
VFFLYKPPSTNTAAGKMDETFGHLCEHLSRDARYELVGLLLEKLGATTKLAAELEITERAVRKWMLRLTHPSNMHLQLILKLALQLDGQRVNEIVWRDLLDFSNAVEPALGNTLPYPSEKIPQPTSEPSVREVRSES